MRRHQSFLLRVWRLARGRSRVEVEHIQSGERALVGSVADALAWIQARSQGTPPPTGSEGASGVARGERDGAPGNEGGEIMPDR
jgi:hypothetical protein